MNPEREKLLESIKRSDLKGAVPSVSATTGQFLHDLVLERGCKSGLEIGTAHGYSTIYLGDALEQNGGVLTTIEHSEPSFNQAKINLYRAKLERTVTQHLGRAQQVIEFELGAPATSQSSNSRNFDFIFIDGIKKSTLEFFELASPLLQKGGLVVVDDVIKFKPKMQTFYDWLESQNQWSYAVHQLEADDGVMVIERA